MKLRAIVVAVALTAAAGLGGCSSSNAPTKDEMRLGEEVQRLEDELAETETSRDDAYNEVEDLEEEVERLEAELHDANAPYETAEDDSFLDETEWDQGLAAARQLLGKQTIAPGYIGNFVEAVSQEEGIHWSPLEQRDFFVRYRTWYGQNYGK